MQCCQHEEACDFRPGGRYEGQDPSDVELYRQDPTDKEVRVEAQRAAEQPAAEPTTKNETGAAPELATPGSNGTQNPTTLGKIVSKGAEERSPKSISESVGAQKARVNQVADDQTPLQKEMSRRLAERRKRQEEQERVESTEEQTLVGDDRRPAQGERGVKTETTASATTAAPEFDQMQQSSRLDQRKLEASKNSNKQYIS